MHSMIGLKYSMDNAIMQVRFFDIMNIPLEIEVSAFRGDFLV